MSAAYEDWEKMLAGFLGGDDPEDPKARKRRRIVDAATALFLRQGFRKTSVDEIARTAGVAKGTVYLYFKTKAHVLLRAVVVEKQRYLGAIKPLFDGSLAPRERLRFWLRTVLVLGTEMPLVSGLLRGERDLVTALEDLALEMDAGAMDMRVELVAELIDQAAAPHRWTPTELRDRAHVLSTLVHFSGFLSDERARGGVSVERFAGILADMIVDGVSRTGGDR